MLTDLSWFRSLKWGLGLAIGLAIIIWFYLFQFPYYGSFAIFLEEQILFLVGVVLLTLLGIQLGFSPVEQWIQRQHSLNLYLQRLDRYGEALSRASNRKELLDCWQSETIERFPYESAVLYEYDDENHVLQRISNDSSYPNRIKDPAVLEAFHDLNVLVSGEEANLAVEHWQRAIYCPVSGLSGPTYLALLHDDKGQAPEAFHRILGRMLAEQLGETVRQVEQLEREQAIQEELNEEIERNTREIRRQRQFLRSILNSLDEGLVVLGGDDQVQLINPTARKTLDLREKPSYEQLAQSLPREILNNDDETHPQTVKHQERTLEYEWHSVHNRDSRLLIFRDRTEIKRLEDQLRVNETLSTLGEMASAVVHELRNPLGGMEMYLGMIRRKTDDPQLDKPIRQLEEGFQSIQNITETLLNYTKTSHAQPEDIDLNQLLESVLEQCRDTIQKRNVDVQRDLPDVPDVRGDFEQLHTVFVNLIRNGIEAQANDPGIDISGSVTDHHIKIAVRDYGEGIEPDEEEQLFDRFFTTKSEGTGLGLALCKRMVEAHSGDILVDSSPGKGSTFTVKLPRMDKPSTKRN